MDQSSKYPNRVPLSVTLQRINKAPLEDYKVDAPGANGDENREPKDMKKK